MKAYVSSGWFTDEQEDARQDILYAIDECGYDAYSPREDLLYVPGETKAADVFAENIRMINECDIVIASTAGKDMGTIFECGVAYSVGVPIVYYWKNGSGI